MLPATRRNWNWRTLPVAVAYAATMVLFAVSTKLTTAANAVFLQAMAPFYVLLLAPLLLKEAIRKVDILVIAAAVSGAALLFSGSEHRIATAPNPHLGNILGFGAGLTWALTLTGLRWLGRDTSNEHAASTVITGNLIACIACLPVALPISRASSADIAVLLYLGIFQIGLAYIALTRSIRYVPVLEASILLLLEPVFNPLWTWIVHRESPGWYAAAGGALIILATAFSAWWKTRSPLALAT